MPLSTVRLAVCLSNNLKKNTHITFFTQIIRESHQFCFSVFNRNSHFNISSNCFLHNRNMVVFTQKINGVTGSPEWDVQDDDYDYHQEIARSAFADMLHDTERNQKYFLALKAAICKMHESGKPANVLDIGTGTGLLSMMAAQCGADSIVACEAFQPMADCALKIIEDNGFADKITVIPKRSTELVVGEDGDLKCKANILVTEVFDTELIGEGAIQTFSHAHSHLLEKDCIVVPNSATIYAQVVECPILQRWNKFMDLADEEGDILVKTPSQMKECNGSAAVHDIQLSQLDLSSFREVLKPIPVLQYDWSGKTPLQKNASTTSIGKALITCNAQMVFMWWDLKMDTEGKILLSCAPWWYHPDADPKHKTPQDTIPWRDHWMQAVYYFPKEIPVMKGDELSLISSQDEYSLWFNLNNGKAMSQVDTSRPVCDCGVHMTYSRTHVAYMNDGTRNKKMLRVLKKNIKDDTICLCLNGGSLMGLAAAKMGARKVVYIESGIIAKRILHSYISFNNLSESVVVLPDIEAVSDLFSNDQISLIFGDPNFSSAILPWDNLHLGHVIGKYKSTFNKDVKIIPGSCSIWAMTVEFFDLHKIKAPLNICENINLKLFDDLVKDSRSKSDEEIEPQPLWEYPCMCRSTPVKIVEIDLKNAQETIQTSGFEPCQIDGIYNGFVLWLEWEFDGDKKNKISTGPIVQPELNKRVVWDQCTRQGVKILEENQMQQAGDLLSYSVKCNLSSGLIDIKVSIKK